MSQALSFSLGRVDQYSVLFANLLMQAHLPEDGCITYIRRGEFAYADYVALGRARSSREAVARAPRRSDEPRGVAQFRVRRAECRLSPWPHAISSATRFVFFDFDNGFPRRTGFSSRNRRSLHPYQLSSLMDVDVSRV